MGVKLVIQKTLMPGVPSAKAYQLIFTDDNAYFLFLSRDWGGFGGPAGNVLGKMATAAAGAVSHNIIADKLKEIEGQDLDALAAKEKGSAKIAYGDITSFKHKKKSIWGGDAHVVFNTRTSGKFKFTFKDEESREAIVAIVGEKRPDLLR